MDKMKRKVNKLSKTIYEWLLTWYNADISMEVIRMKYRCMACGYIYDDEAEGVKFEDLPEDWVCPLCGVGKDMFEKKD